MKTLNIVKKISLVFVGIMGLFTGGLFLFILTQGDYILEQISLIVEDATGSPLIIEEMPSLGFSPMPNITIHKSSWGNEEMYVAFDSAAMHFSILKLIQGEIDINEVALHSPKIYYDDTKIQPTSTNTSTQSTETEVTAEAEELTFEQMLAPVPKNIIMTNAYIEYKDKDQHLVMQNFNIEINDFAVNKPVSAEISSIVSYTMLQDNSNFTFDFDLESDFILNEDTLDFDMSNMSFNPKNGFGFTTNMNFTTKALVYFEDLNIENFTTTIRSSFMNMNITQNGTLTPENINISISSTLYPKTLGRAFQIDMPDTKELDSMRFNSNIAYANDIASFSNMSMTFGESSFTSSIVYNMKADSIKGSFTLANMNLNNYFPPETETSSTTSTSSSTASAEPILMPDILAKTSFDLGMKMTNITYDTIVLDSFSTTMTGKNSRLLMNAIDMQVLGSSIKMSLDLDLSSKQFASTSIQIPSLDIARYAKALMDMDGLLGTMSLNTSISCSILDPFANMNGSGQMVFSKLGVESAKLGTLSKILKAANLADEYFEFADGQVPYTITNSVVKLTNAYVNSNKYYVSSNGTINLKNDALDLEVQAGNDQKATIPVTIRGTMSDPKVTITAKNIANTAIQILEDNIDKEAVKATITTEVEKITEKVTEEATKAVDALTNKVTEEVTKGASSLINSLIKK